MKKTMAIVTLLLSLSAMAQERVVLNKSEISINSGSAVIVRNSKAPSTVKLNFRVSLNKQVCVNTQTRMTLQTSGAYCGYDIRRDVVIASVCIERNRRDECVRSERRHELRTIEIPRTCPVPESYCAEYGTTTVTDTNSMKIQFKGLSRLGGSEEETFLVVARQKNYDANSVDYDVKALETVGTYKISQKKFLGMELDSYVVEEK